MTRTKTTRQDDVELLLSGVRTLRLEIDAELRFDAPFGFDDEDDSFGGTGCEWSPEIVEARFERIRDCVERMEEAAEKLGKRLRASNRQLQRIQEADESIWPQKSRLESPPPFKTFRERPTAPSGGKTRIVSFVNLKGGVGKTTLTANLVAAFASGNYRDEKEKIGKPARVLVVDLDFQGTLSQRCVKSGLLEEAYKNDLTSCRLLRKPKDLEGELDNLSLSFVGAPTAELIPANEKLDVYDARRLNQQASGAFETRFLFRDWFHTDEIFRKYDYVFFDCPPRLTASSVCALVASDFAFIPTAPESFDVNAVSRTLNWIGKTRENLNPELNFGGAILNRTNNEKGLTALEERNKIRIKTFYQDYCENFQIVPVRAPVLESFVPRRSGGNHINGADGTALSGANSPYLNRLATEIYRRIQCR